MSIGHSANPKNPNSDNGQGEHVSQEWRSCYQYYNLVDLAFEQLDPAYMQPVGNINKLPMQKLSVSRTIKEPGYVYIYISNEGSVQQDVFFDDLKVTHKKSPIIQTNDYYPFGLTFNSNQRENSVKQDYLYNSKELQDELNLGWLDYGARMCQPELGRFFTQDRFSEKCLSMTPYQYGANNPLIYIDINGDSIVNAHQSEMQAIADDLNRIYESKYGEENVFSVQERTKTEKRRTNDWSIWDPSTWGNAFEEPEYEDVQVTDYVLTGREDFDWSQDKYTEGMSDLMQTSQNISVDIVADNGAQYKQSVRISIEGLLKDYGGGYTVSSNSVILSDKLKQTTAANSGSWTLGGVAMHELLYHIHPQGKDEGGESKYHERTLWTKERKRAWCWFKSYNNKEKEMMRMSVVIFVFQFAFFISCNTRELSLSLFSIDNNEVKVSDLVKRGFTKSEVDVIMLETTYADTTVMFEYDRDANTFLSKRWEFNLSDDYLNEMRTIFDKNDVHLMVPNSYSEIAFGKFFSVLKSDSNRPYFCLLEKGETVRMHIVFYFPK